jgi:hypothetical protein
MSYKLHFYVNFTVDSANIMPYIFITNVKLTATQAQTNRKFMATDRKISVVKTSNSTPNRKFDYVAVFAGYDEGEPIGYGANPNKAIKNLKFNAAEENENV